MRPDKPELPALVEHRMAQIRCDLQAEMVKLELRITKWLFIGAIGIVGVVVWIAMPQLTGVPLLLFFAGTATQMYSVARM